jgi:hypothetical protein
MDLYSSIIRIRQTMARMQLHVVKASLLVNIMLGEAFLPSLVRASSTFRIRQVKARMQLQVVKPLLMHILVGRSNENNSQPSFLDRTDRISKTKHTAL